MGYEFLITSCYVCGNVLTCNPEKVPSVKDGNGVKQPLCRACVDVITAKQKKMGVQQWLPPLPGAYGPREVPY